MVRSHYFSFNVLLLLFGFVCKVISFLGWDHEGDQAPPGPSLCGSLALLVVVDAMIRDTRRPELIWAAYSDQVSGPGVRRGHLPQVVKGVYRSWELSAAPFLTVRRKPLWRKRELSQHSEKSGEEWQGVQSLCQCPWNGGTTPLWAQSAYMNQLKFLFPLQLIQVGFLSLVPSRGLLRAPPLCCFLFIPVRQWISQEFYGHSCERVMELSS